MAANHNLGGMAKNYAHPGNLAGSDMSGPNAGLHLHHPQPSPGQYFNHDLLSPSSNGGTFGAGNIMVSHNQSGANSKYQMSKNNSKEQLRERRHQSTIPVKNSDLKQGASSVRQENHVRAQ